MPVTTKPSPLKSGTNRDKAITINVNDRSWFDDITDSCTSPYVNDSRRNNSGFGFHECQIVASSIGPESKRDRESINKPVPVSICENGFVGGIIRAFNQNLDLVIRPDDVWQAILSQFSLFIHRGGNDEYLEEFFGCCEERETLALDLTMENLSRLNFEQVARGFAGLFRNKVADSGLNSRILTEFNTSKFHDLAVAAFSMMGAMQTHSKHGAITAMIGGGFPSVTLEGDPRDWKELEGRVKELRRYGKECQDWVSLLQPIIQDMRKTFDDPDTQEVKDFWLRIVWETGHTGVSGDPCKISGWITAFEYFEDGSVTTDYRHYEETSDRGQPPKVEESYPIIHPKDILRSLAVVPITITDSEAGVKRFCTAVAGTIGMFISDESESHPLSKSQPFSAWWIVEEFVEPF